MVCQLLINDSPLRGVSFQLLFAIEIMFTIQYWNPAAAEWRGTGAGTIYDRTHAIQRMNAMADQCDHCVRFRIEQLFDRG